jgi:hypothetical protein
VGAFRNSIEVTNELHTLYSGEYVLGHTFNLALSTHYSQ